jgi:putative membrane protein
MFVIWDVIFLVVLVVWFVSVFIFDVMMVKFLFVLFVCVVLMGVFMAGCIIGLSLFSRLLSWLFARHHDLIVSMLIGFMIGSLRKVWPWKEVVETRLNSHGEIVPLVERNIMPLINTSFYVAVALAILGVALILVLDRVQVTREHMEDI